MCIYECVFIRVCMCGGQFGVGDGVEVQVYICLHPCVKDDGVCVSFNVVYQLVMLFCNYSTPIAP